MHSSYTIRPQGKPAASSAHNPSNMSTHGNHRNSSSFNWCALCYLPTSCSRFRFALCVFPLLVLLSGTLWALPAFLRSGKLLSSRLLPPRSSININTDMGGSGNSINNIYRPARQPSEFSQQQQKEGKDGRPVTEFRFLYPTISVLTDAAIEADKRQPLSMSPRDVVDLASDPRASLMNAMARRFLSQWASIDEDPTGLFARPMVTQDVRQALRNASRTSAMMLVRIVRGKLFVRYPVGSYDHWWRKLRVDRTLLWIKSALSLYSEAMKDVTVECTINLVDTPGSYDSGMLSSRTTPALPFFSPASSGVHLDIPIPDAVDQGPGYMPDQEVLDALIPWKDRIPKAFYAGAPRPFPTYLSNIGANPRLRLKAYSFVNNSMLDVHFHKWSAVDQAAIDKLEAHNITIGPAVNASIKASYQFLILASGAIHSSSICGAMAAAQVVILQDMGFMEYFYPAMEPWKHFAPVRKPFDNLLETIQYLKTHPSVGAAMSEATKAFSNLFCTDAGRTLYWAVLLKEWSKITHVEEDLREPHVCGVDVYPKGKLPSDPPQPCNKLTPEKLEEARQLERKTCQHQCTPVNAFTDDLIWVRLQ